MMRAMLQIGPHRFDSPLLLAPMAGITDKPFRRLCRRMGAALAVSEMLTADSRHWASAKSRRRMDHAGEAGPVSVQLVGHDPRVLAEAARMNEALGADIININMGCPARKVASVASGSALLRDEPLVGRILDAVVGAVRIPVTLKMRTGYSRADRNALRIARLAQSAGIAAIAVHGRTREDFFNGDAEHDTAATLRAALRIPLIANGDIATPARAREVLARTGCDALMIGRAARGRPWIFRELAAALAGDAVAPPAEDEFGDVVLEHLDGLYSHYGETTGVRIARKHLAWYCAGRPGAAAFRAAVNRVERADEQRRLTRRYLLAGASSLGCGGRLSSTCTAVSAPSLRTVSGRLSPQR